MAVEVLFDYRSQRGRNAGNQPLVLSQYVVQIKANPVDVRGFLQLKNNRTARVALIIFWVAPDLRKQLIILIPSHSFWCGQGLIPVGSHFDKFAHDVVRHLTSYSKLAASGQLLQLVDVILREVHQVERLYQLRVDQAQTYLLSSLVVLLRREGQHGENILDLIFSAHSSRLLPVRQAVELPPEQLCLPILDAKLVKVLLVELHFGWKLLLDYA